MRDDIRRGMIWSPARAQTVKQGDAMAAQNPAGGADPHGAKGTDQLQIRFPGTAEAVRQALADLMQKPLLTECSPSMAVNAEIVLAEVMNNIVEHAYAVTTGEICLTLRRSPAGIACQLTDCGAPMPGLTPPAGKFQELGNLDDLPEGGFGWFLIRSLVEGLSYRRENGENHLSFLLYEEQSEG